VPVLGSLPSAPTAGLRGAAKGSSDVVSPLQHPPTGRGDAPRAPGSPAPGSTKGWSPPGRLPCLCFVAARGRGDLRAGVAGRGFPSSPPRCAQHRASGLHQLALQGACFVQQQIQRVGWVRRDMPGGEGQPAGQPAQRGAGRRLPRLASPRARQGRVSARRNNSRNRRDKR